MQPRTSNCLRFTGVNRSGHHIMGEARPGESAGNLAHRLYRNRYKRVIIYETGTGREVGGISHDGKRRIWWGEHE